MNGYLDWHFHGKRWLRQGGPISPYFFLLVMEACHTCLEVTLKVVTFSFTLDVQSCKYHICFADYLFLLCAANVESVEVLKASMEEFSQMSRLYPNLQKKRCFMAGVSGQLKLDICTLMGMSLKELPDKYLGVPLISSRLKYSNR